MKNSSLGGARASVAGDSVAVAGAVGGLSMGAVCGVCAWPTLIQVSVAGNGKGRLRAPVRMLVAACRPGSGRPPRPGGRRNGLRRRVRVPRSEEHTSELQSLMRNSYAVFCLKKNRNEEEKTTNQEHLINTVHNS